MKTISILHPFTPKAAGALENSVPTYHSQPHVKAMEALNRDGYECFMEYFTSKLFKYELKGKNIKWKFYPVSYTLNGDHKKWKKQSSTSCFQAYEKQTPDLTIINMAGHSSVFSFVLSQLILAKKKKYIAMLGGQHYLDNERNRAYYKHADHILVHTHMQKAAMETMDLFKGKDIRVFPLGVNCTVFKPLDTIEDKKPITLLYVGRIVEWKRIHMAIQALKKLVDEGFKDAILNIIGPVSSEVYFKKLNVMVNEFNLQKNVFFLGHKEHNELPYYYQQADLFTLPSDKETFGMVMIEAMACGTPVAGINCPGGPADVIIHEVNGILTSPENYNEEILKYFNNPALQIKMSERARAKVVEEYNIEATYKVLKSSVMDALK